MSQTNLLEKFARLEQKRQAMLAQLAQEPEAKTSTPPAPGKWSALQVVAHLIKAESGSMAYIAKKLQYRTRIPPIGWPQNLRMWAAKVFFSSPIKIKAPGPVAEVPEAPDLPTLEKDWAALRARMKKTLEDFPPELEKRAVLKHPFCGRISMAQTLDFFEFHLDRHQKQINRILDAG
jgi:hypothetical protein